MHYLAARLNIAVGAEVCQYALQAVNYARTLLDSIKFNGTSSFLTKSNTAAYAKALCLKDCLEKYNLGDLCPWGTCTNCANNTFYYPSSVRIDDQSYAEFMTNNEMIGVFPNPVKDHATIMFMVGENSHAVMEVFAYNGTKVATLMDRNVQEGETVTLDFNSESVAAGLYFCKLTMNGQVYTHKMLINK